MLPDLPTKKRDIALIISIVIAIIALVGWFKAVQYQRVGQETSEPIAVRIPEYISQSVSERLVKLGWDSNEAYEVAARARQSTVCVIATEGSTFCSGTGVVIGPTLVATCGHCTHGVVSIRTLDGKIMSARKLANHPTADLGLIRITSNIRALPPPLTLGFASPGEPVIAIGNPSGVGTWVMVLGEVLSVDSWGEGGYLADMPSRSGMSGGPAVNRKGEVIGIVSGSTTEGDVPDPYPFELVSSLEGTVSRPATIESGTKLRDMILRYQ